MPIDLAEEEVDVGPGRSGEDEVRAVPEPETIRLLVEQAERQIDLQDGQWNSLRTKAAIVLGSAGVVFGKTAEWHAPSSALGLWTYVATLMLLLVASLAALGALLPTRIRLDPAPGPLMEKYWLSPAGDLRLHLLPNLADTYEYNQRVLRRIATPLRVAVISLGLALVVFFAITIAHWRSEW